MAVRSNDRILILDKIDSEAKMDKMVDPGVLTGANKLRVFADPGTLLWMFRYEKGTIPPALRSRWTSCREALEAATRYLRTKNLKIVEVQD